MSEIPFLYYTDVLPPTVAPQPSVRRDAIDVALKVGKNSMAGRELVATILSVSLQLRQQLQAQQQKAAVKLHLRLRWQTYT